MDENGVAIVCGRDANNMFAIETDGTAHKTMLLANKAIPGPVCVTCYHDPVDKKTKVYVGTYNSSQFYRLTLQ